MDDNMVACTRHFALAFIVVIASGCANQNAALPNSDADNTAKHDYKQTSEHSEIQPTLGCVFPCEIIAEFDTGNGTSQSVTRISAGTKHSIRSTFGGGDESVGERIIEFVKHELGQDVYRFRFSGPDGSIDHTLRFAGDAKVEFTESNHSVSIHPLKNFDNE